MIYDLIIVGAGASGLMAAITALEQKCTVLILEENSKIGRKILASGNGRCNFTHETIALEDYYTDDYTSLQHLLNTITVQDVIKRFEEFGMYSRNKNGYFYPLSENAVTVLDVLRCKVLSLGGQIRTDSKVLAVKKNPAGFEVHGENFRMPGKSVLLAMGSKAGGFCKDSGNMPYEIGKAFRIKTSKLYPSLTRLHCREAFFKVLAGVRIQAEVSLFENNKKCLVEKGEVQFTKTGISGIAVFQLSGYIAQALDKGSKIEVHMNFVKELNITDSEKWMNHRMQHHTGKNLEEFFLGILPQKITLQCIMNAGFKADTLVKKMRVEDLLKVYRQMEDFCVHITEVDSMENAQVCRGGFYLNQFDKNLQYKNCSGLFASGEILNVDGICGGYNLHFAWVSGIIAGRGAINYVQHQ